MRLSLLRSLISKKEGREESLLLLGFIAASSAAFGFLTLLEPASL